MNTTHRVLRWSSRLLDPLPRVKNILRYGIVLRFRPNVPRELMLNDGDCVVQVGTPSTSTLRRLAECVGQSGKVIVIEPAPLNVQRLSSCRERHGWNNVTIVPKAAWNKAGHHRLLLAGRDDDHRLENDGILHDNDLRQQRDHGDYEETLVEVDTLDAILKDVGVQRVNYVEIAVNGAEQQVLQGMPATLKYTDHVFVKGHPRDRETGRAACHLLSDFLQTRGFRTQITKQSRAADESWGKREGDVYAWRRSAA